MDYSYKVQNRQITLKTVEKIANYLEDLKEDYEKKFEKDDRQNKNLQYNEKNYEYGKGNIKLLYEIEYINGENIKEENYNWFVSNLNKPKDIKYIGIRLETSFEKTEQDMRSSNEKSNVYNCIIINIKIKQNEVYIYANTNKQENTTNKIFNDIINDFNNNEERVNNTIKHRNIRRFCFCTTVGIIISYIIYFILKISINVFPEEIVNLLNNKTIMIFSQWFIAISFGQLIAGWYIAGLYQPIEPKMSCVGHKKYEDNIEFYIKESEVHIAQYWDAGERRNKIERIYKFCKKVLLLQLIISFIFLVF